MMNKLKLPLTAVNIFLVSGLVFYPGEAIDAANSNISSNQPSESQKIVNKVNYNFLTGEIELSNLTIEKQLKSYSVKTSEATIKAELIDSNTVINLRAKISVKKVSYEFSASALKASNLAINQQLGRYVASYDKEININTNPISINELEVPEQPETAVLVNNAAGYSNEDVIVKTKLKLKKYTAVTFSKSKLKSSNLAIDKQLRNYKMVSIKSEPQTKPSANSSNKAIVKSIAEPSIANKLEDTTLTKLERLGSKKLDSVLKLSKKSKPESESELLISNSAHEEDDEDVDDDEDFSRISNRYKIKQAKEQQKLSVTNIHNSTVMNEEDDEDEDEYGSERVVFNNEPYYFTESFEKKSESIIDDNIALPKVEDIHESTNAATNDELSITEIELIEEIEISDDGTIITSQAK